MTHSQQNLIDKDKRYIWHPFTQMKDYCASNPIIIERGEGVRLIDIHGNSYYDGVSSLWVNVHGHQVHEIDEAVNQQLSKIAHSTLLGLGNVPSILLAERIIKIAPKGLTKLFYSDSGSEAVEIGLKIAYQYWQLKGEKNRNSFIAMTEAYHGDTLGATSVGGMDLFHKTFKGLLFKTFRVPYPFPYRFNGNSEECSDHCLQKLENVLNSHPKDIAGVILEPLVQGAAGMIMMPDGFLSKVAELCCQFNILLLTDEVATGFGRTGKMFACDHEKITPDIMMIAKGLTGGYLPLAATLVKEKIYEAFLGDYQEKKTFFHGHSYTGNQLCCAAALANIDLIEKNNLIHDVERKSKLISKHLEPLNTRPHVGDIRIKGFMVGIELVKNKNSKAPYLWQDQMGNLVCNRSRELGMIIRPLGNVIVFMPPLVSTDNELKEMIKIIIQSIMDVTEND